MPILDRDLNLLQDLIASTVRAVVARYIGSGVPSGNQGFQIAAGPAPNNFRILAGNPAPGRCLVGGIEVVIARDLDGSVYAFRNRCAHMGARLSGGRLLEKVVGDDVDQYKLTDELVLRCPWHGFEFELGSGRCLPPPGRVRRRPRRLTGGHGPVRPLGGQGAV